MYKKRKIDFVLHEYKYTFMDMEEKIIFRFYPRQSSCHSFDEEPPKSWKDVYKVYYEYAIIKQYKHNNKVSSDVVFKSYCDECSIIDEIAYRCKLIADGKKSVKKTWDNEEHTIKLLNNEVFPIGDGVSWDIRKTYKNDMFLIELFNSADVGFRFCLDKEKLREFGEYLSECCEYMLSVGEPI